jgi:hypothetical protein
MKMGEGKGRAGALSGILFDRETAARKQPRVTRFLFARLSLTFVFSYVFPWAH